jgi:hypothetical protein
VLDRSLLHRPYNFIACNEVAEHFFTPHTEFDRWSSRMLRHGGLLAIATRAPPHAVVEAQLQLRPSVDGQLDADSTVTPSVKLSPSPFAQWWYARDPTHVAFYSDQTFRWIEQKYDFKRLIRTDEIWIGRSIKDTE